MDAQKLRELVEILSEGGWDYASITTDEFTLSVGDAPSGTVGPNPVTATLPAPATSEPTPPVLPAATPSAPATSDSSPVVSNTAAGHTVTAPSVGVAWRAPKPGAAPFVEVGQQVAAGDTLVLLEVMKLFSPVNADVAGTVTAIHIADGEMVEYGTALITIDPA